MKKNRSKREKETMIVNHFAGFFFLVPFSDLCVSKSAINFRIERNEMEIHIPIWMNIVEFDNALVSVALPQNVCIIFPLSYVWLFGLCFSCSLPHMVSPENGCVYACVRDALVCWAYLQLDLIFVCAYWLSYDLFACVASVHGNAQSQSVIVWSPCGRRVYRVYFSAFARVSTLVYENVSVLCSKMNRDKKILSSSVSSIFLYIDHFYACLRRRQYIIFQYIFCLFFLLLIQTWTSTTKLDCPCLTLHWTQRSARKRLIVVWYFSVGVERILVCDMQPNVRSKFTITTERKIK